MTTLTRRSLTAALGAAVVAIPAVGLPVAAGNDRLLEMIRLYREHMKAICDECRKRGMDDEELDLRMDRSEAILDEAASLPALTAVSAIAAIDLVLEDEDSPCSVVGEHRTALLNAVKDYIEGRAA